ncbi:UxaA family hydrolase [Rubritalea marina]|uniref:UxaA family hydrolase n=1 Tax=Rubritalea marina TaxID=361055 RepID=UPI000377CBE4|nr:altronate dehydratase family protein [Rubritalea marina]
MTTLQLDPRDNVLVALTDLAAGDTVQHGGQSIALRTEVNAKHKFPIQDLKAGDKVTMYGVLVGTVSEDVPAGTLLHTHNLHHAADPFGIDLYEEGSFEWSTKPDVSAFEGRTFQGFHREDGSVGTANYWLVIPMVFCENRNLRMLQNALLKPLGYGKSEKYEDFAERLAAAEAAGQALAEVSFESEESVLAQRLFPNVDGIKFLAHSMGCGSDRGDSDSLCRLLAGYATHPNVAGVTVLSLGCQHAQVSILKEEMQKRCPSFNRPLQVFEQQAYPSEEVLLEDAMRQIFAGLTQVNRQTREEAPITKLSVGMECGGSDGFSGISANPAIGHVTDVLSMLNGRAVLSEFPELCGVEADLIRRCQTQVEAKRFIQIMEDYNARAEAIGSGFSMNPSPGNITDGLITDAIKSAGAAKKGGTAPVVDVLDYTEPLRRDGLSLVCTPGNDVESTTAMTGSGCNVILFSTGLGTPTGNPICPVIKVASNTTTAERHPDLIDYNAGTVIEGKESIQEAGNRLLEMILEVASGNHTTKAVGLGQDDFIPWRRGVSL